MSVEYIRVQAGISFYFFMPVHHVACHDRPGRILLYHFYNNLKVTRSKCDENRRATEFSPSDGKDERPGRGGDPDRAERERRSCNHIPFAETSKEEALPFARSPLNYSVVGYLHLHNACGRDNTVVIRKNEKTHNSDLQI